MARLDVFRNLHVLLKQLPPDVEELAAQHKQLETRFGNAKITTAEQLLKLFFVHVGDGLSLRQTAALVTAAGGPRVAPMRIHMKLRQAAPYLRALIERMCPWTREAARARWGGYQLVPVITMPLHGSRAESPGVRLHVMLSLPDVAVLDVSVELSARRGCQMSSSAPEQLVIVDGDSMSASSQPSLFSQGAAVLARLNGRGPDVNDARGHRLDVARWARFVCGRFAVERPATLISPGSGGEICGRLLVRRREPRESAQEQARLRCEYGAMPPKALLELTSHLVLFTTAPRLRLPTASCFEAYRFSNRAKTLFDRWRSIGGLHQLLTARPDTIRAQLYTSVLLALLIERLHEACAPFRGAAEPDIVQRRDIRVNSSGIAAKRLSPARGLARGGRAAPTLLRDAPLPEDACG